MTAVRDRSNWASFSASDLLREGYEVESRLDEPYSSYVIPSSRYVDASRQIKLSLPIIRIFYLRP